MNNLLTLSFSDVFDLDRGFDFAVRGLNLKIGIFKLGIAKSETEGKSGSTGESAKRAE